jgi:hypothetical protein
MQWVRWALISRVRQPERESNHQPSSSAKVKNAWSYTSTLPIRLHGVMRIESVDNLRNTKTSSTCALSSSSLVGFHLQWTDSTKLVFHQCFQCTYGIWPDRNFEEVHLVILLFSPSLSCLPPKFVAALKPIRNPVETQIFTRSLVWSGCFCSCQERQFPYIPRTAS